MTTLTPPLWLGSAVTAATVPATSVAAPYAQTPVAERRDSYIRAGSAVSPRPQGAVTPFPEDLIRFDGLGLPHVHRAGVGADPSAILSEFPDVRRFKNGRADALAVLWRQYDEEVAALALDVRHDREYLDPENPLKLGEDAAELADIRPQYRPELIALHHELRRSLAEEQTFIANLRKDLRYSVRFRVVNAPAEPVRDGTVAVDRAAIVALLDRYEKFAKPLSRDVRARLERGLVLVAAARGFQAMKAWAQRPTVAATVDRILPHWNQAGRKRVVFFQSVLEAAAQGRELFPDRGGRTTHWKVFKSVAAALGVPMEEMLRQALGPAVERWKGDHFLRMDLLKDLLSLCNLLGASEPWRLAWRLHQEELTWAFAVADLGRGALGFEIDPETDLKTLREHGFGGLLTAARMERGWNLPRLREAVTAAYGADVSLERLGAVAANREQPDFPLLRAIVAGLATHETALPVDPAEAFLAAYPTFIDLLPLAARDERKLLKPAATAPVAFVPYAAPIAAAATVTSREDDKSLDSEGFAYLIVKARGLRRLTVTAAARRLGIAAATLARYERESGERADSLPGRITLNVVCAPDGYDLTRGKALEAHFHSYWRQDPAAALLKARNGDAPLFLEENNAAQWRAFAAFPERTPGEILFSWRNGVPSEGKEVVFLPTETQQASFLGVPLATYRRWEGNAFAPSRAEAEALCARLGRSEDEARAFSDACERLRAVRLRESTESAEAVIAGLETFPALGRFAASLALRPFFGEDNRDRLNCKLVALIGLDPTSLAFLEAKISESDGGVAPDSEEAARLIAAVHRAEEKARLWPEGIERLGPIVAYAYHRHRADKAVWGRLARALRNPRVDAVIFGEDGSCEISGLAARGGHPPAKVAVSGAISRPDARAVTAIIRRLKAAGRLNNKARVKSFSDRAVALAQHDETSFRDFLARAAGETDWDRLCGALENAANFVRKWKGTVAWTGSVFGYYYDNDEKGAKGRRSAAIYLRTRLDRGNVAAVRFDGKRVGFEHAKAPAAGVRRGAGAQTFSYAEAAAVRFLPNPSNDWGRRDLGLPWRDVQARVTAFFERLEKRIAKTPIEIQRILGRSYYAVRTGADVLGGEFLSDEVLERLGLDDASKEELRHLEALLLVARGEGQEREEGPYVAAARLLRYYRFLHQKKQSEVKGFYKGGPSIVGPADYELGRMAVDPATLPAITEGLGIPAPFRAEFAARLERDYAAIDARRAAKAKIERSFPNRLWTIPHEDWTEADALVALKAMALEARGAVSRGDLARNTGLTASHLYKFENFGELSEDAWPIYRKFLEDDGHGDLAQRLRVARAVLDLRRKPSPSGPGFAEAGRLLRFTRLMMIGTSAADVVVALKGGIDPQLHLRWEWGLNRMPDAALASYARILESQGVLAGAAQVSSFVARVRAAYRR